MKNTNKGSREVFPTFRNQVSAMGFIKRAVVPNNRLVKLTDEEINELKEQEETPPQKQESPPNVQCDGGQCQIGKDRD